MASKGTLTVRIVGDAKSFSNTMRKTSGDVKKFGTKLAKLGAVATIAGAAGLAVVGKKLLDAGEAASTANARIENITKQMDLFGAGAAKVSDRLVDLSEKQARQTGISTDQIKESKALLLTFGDVAASADEVGGVFDRASAAALDLAAAGFGSATDNAKQLGKALNDPIKGLAALSKSGVTFTEAEKERIQTLVESNKVGEAQELILAAIEKQVGGTAEATADASAKLRETWDQAVQQVGQKLLPSFERITEWLADRIPRAVETLNGWLDRLSGWWSTHGPRIKETVRGVAEAVTQWWTNTAQPAIENFAEAIRSWWEDTAKPAIRDFRQAWQDNQPAVEGVIESLGNIIESLGTIVRNVMSAVGEEVAGADGDMEEGFGGMMRSVESLVLMLESLVDMIEKVSMAAGAIKDIGGIVQGKGSSARSLWDRAKSAAGFRANGGNVSRGNWLVGERGPEVVSMPGMGRVDPLMAGGGGGGQTTINVNINATDVNPDAVVDALRRYQRRNAFVPITVG